MIERLRSTFRSNIDPEIRRYRVRATPTDGKVDYILLVACLLVGIAFSRLIAAELDDRLTFDLVSIIVLGFVFGFALWLVNRGDVGFAGYLVALPLIAFSAYGIVVSPNNLYVFSAGFLLAIMTVGTIVGGTSVYPFSIIAFLTLTFGWFRARSTSTVLGGALDNFSGAFFLSTQAIVYFGMAVMLYTLSQLIRNTTEKLHSQTEQLTNMAHTDPLTNLANRRHLLDQLELEFNRARRYRRPLSLVYLDLDGFKAINDRFGHLMGDEILRGVSIAMLAVLRSGDLLARIGGDEFSVLLPETNLESARRVTNKLRKALTAYSQNLASTIPPVSFCAGVGQLRIDDESVDDLLARADEAQYRAKDAGKGQIRTQHELDQLPLFMTRSNPNETR
jgi:diguanylate cyclase (GGDEF)-like protein